MGVDFLATRSHTALTDIAVVRIATFTKGADPVRASIGPLDEELLGDLLSIFGKVKANPFRPSSVAMGAEEVPPFDGARLAVDTIPASFSNCHELLQVK